MKNTTRTQLVPNQHPTQYATPGNQTAVIILLIVSILLISLYGNILFALLLVVLPLAIIFNKQSKDHLCKKHSIAAITRFMSDKHLPADLKVQVSYVHKQKYILLSSPKCPQNKFLLIDIINPDALNVQPLQKEIKHFQQHNYCIYLIVAPEKMLAENLKAQISSFVNVYHIYGSVDHCLEHIRGKLVKASILAKVNNS